MSRTGLHAYIVNKRTYVRIKVLILYAFYGTITQANNLCFIIKFKSIGGIAMTRAIDLAKYVVNKCTVDSKPVSNLQLQKILYFIQLNFLRLLENYAFSDDIYAWRHGPVIPQVYDAFCVYGATKICRVYNIDNNIFTGDFEHEIVDKVIEMCRDKEPWKLVEQTHRVDGPWYKVYDGDPQTIIPKNSLKEYSKRN